MVNKVGNITFECDNPRELSIFWADVMGYPRSEWPPELEAQLRASGLTDEDLARRSVAEDPDGEGPRMFFRKAHEPKTARNMMHLDLRAVVGRRASPEEIDAEKDRIVGLGARMVRHVDRTWGPFPEYYYMLTDPEGNEFCVQ